MLITCLRYYVVQDTNVLTPGNFVQISLANTMEFVRREVEETLTPIDQSYVNYRRRTGEYEVLDLTRALPQGRYYWKLPREFLGERVSNSTLFWCFRVILRDHFCVVCLSVFMCLLK